MCKTFRIDIHNEILPHVRKNIEVLWVTDETCYPGIVTHYDPKTASHRVDCDDGDVELLNIRKEKWRILISSVDKTESRSTAHLCITSDILGDSIAI